MRIWNRLVPQQLHSVAARYNYRLLKDPGPGTVSRLHRESVTKPDGAAVWPDMLLRRDERMTRLEAILVLAREPLSTRKLSQYANLADATEARTLIRQLNERYDQNGRAFRVEEVAGGYQLLTRPKFASWLRRLDGVPKETRLSSPALETLAVIAYRQPAGRAEIEAIRGVNCGEILRQLMDRELVRMAGRSDELGRPYLYATTRRFLQLFGLRSLDELPRAVELKKCGTLPSTTIPPIPNTSESVSPECTEEEPDVTATIRSELAPEELKKLRVGNLSVIAPRARDEDDDVEEDLDENDDADDDDDLDDLEDEELEEEEFDDVDDEELEDDDFEDEEWEEVEDDDEEEEEWEEEDDDDWEDDDEEEEEEEEEEKWE